MYRRTRNCADGLGIVRTNAESYGRTQNRADGLGTVWTESELYGRTQNRTDGLKIVRTDSESYGRTRNHTDKLGIVRMDSGSYWRTRDRGWRHKITLYIYFIPSGSLKKTESRLLYSILRCSVYHSFILSDQRKTLIHLFIDSLDLTVTYEKEKELSSVF